MLTKEQNELITRTGPGTPGGNLLRRFWQPVALSSDLANTDAPLRVKVLGEELLLFRNDAGQLGLIGRYCAHRGADLSYGRLEGGGLRCIYHGWLFDTKGKCVEQPAQPPNKSFCSKVRHPGYPVKELGGLIFAYMGPGEPPVLPSYEALRVPPEHQLMWRFHEDCNYFQGLEGNLDPAHTSYLHRPILPDKKVAETYEYDDVVGDSKEGAGELFGESIAPDIETETTDYGERIFAIRSLADESRFVRVSNFVVPNIGTAAGPTGDDGYSILWHVPIDDFSHIKYMLTFKRSAPVDKSIFRKMLDAEVLPDGRYRRSKENNYLQSREEMRTKWYLGMGPLFPLHDSFVTESMGPIVDRSAEHLGSADRGIVAARQLVLRAIKDCQQGREPQNVLRDPKSAEVSNLITLSKRVKNAEGTWKQALGF